MLPAILLDSTPRCFDLGVLREAHTLIISNFQTLVLRARLVAVLHLKEVARLPLDSHGSTHQLLGLLLEAFVKSR